MTSQMPMPIRGDLIDATGKMTAPWVQYFRTLQVTIPDVSGYVVANPPITPDTKIKITYDEKGLVTGGSDATTTDIPEGDNLYFTSLRVASLIQNGTHITWSYDPGSNTLTGNVSITLQDAYDQSVADTGYANVDVGAGVVVTWNLTGNASNFNILNKNNNTALDILDYNVLVGVESNGEFSIQDFDESIKPIKYSATDSTLYLDGGTQIKDSLYTENDYLTVGT